MKNIKWANILVAICYIVGGFILLSNPYIGEELICGAIGYGAIGLGALELIIYFVYPIENRVFKNDFVVGLSLLTIGIVAFVYMDLFLEITYIILAMVILVSGFMKLKDGLDASVLGGHNGTLYFILALISIGFGLIILFNSYIFNNTFATKETMHRLIGAGLLFSGISDFISAIYVSGKVNSYKKELDRLAKERLVRNEEVKPVEQVKTPEIVETPVEEKPENE